MTVAETKLKVAILFGGIGTEYRVSCWSAASVLKHIDHEKYEVLLLGIDQKGRWMLTKATAKQLDEDKWADLPSNLQVTPCFDEERRGLFSKRGKYIPVDCFFPVTHGTYGEDGTLQGILEMMRLPYVGSGVLASAVAMDKGITKIVAGSAGIRQAKYYVTDRFKFSSGPMEEIDAAEKAVGGYPVFVKPANAGSSVGVTKATDRKELFDSIRCAADFDHKIIIEESIKGRELEVAVLGDRDPQASPVGEIVAAGEFYTFEAKYENPVSKAEVAENLPPEIEEELRRTAIRVYELIGCRGLSRVDFFLDEEGRVIFNEINTLPGFTVISMYPKLWEAGGLNYSELIDKLITLALDKE